VNRLVFEDVRLIDGLAADARDHVDVTVEDGRIGSIEDHRPRDHAEGVGVVKGSGHSLLPGLIDCHAHYTIDASLEVADGIAESATNPPERAAFIGARNARLALFSGVTTARSAGAAHGMDVPLRDAIERGEISGPRMRAAGPSITITGGHGWKFGLQADGVPELVKAVRTICRDGADHLKIVASEAAMLTSAVAGVEELTEPEIRAIVAEAARLHRRVMAHAQNSAAVVAAARGGVASVEHAFLADGDALEVLAASGACLTPTLTVTDVYRTIPDLSEARRARQREIEKAHRWSCQTAIALGIPLVAGTDCGVRGVLPTMLPREVRNLHDHGLPAMEAIKAATSRAARLLGVDGEVGTVEVGKRADLLLVAGDPLADLRALEAVAAVVQGGAIVVRG